MAKITYPEKVSNNGQTIQGKFFSADANEIKASVNALYDLIFGRQTPIPITADGDFTVANWQTDIVPDDTLTYAERFGNSIRDVKGMRDLLDGTFELYSPSDVIVTLVDEEITTATFYQVYIGTLSIL